MIEFLSRLIELLNVAIDSKTVKSNYTRVLALITNEIPEATLEGRVNNVS